MKKYIKYLFGLIALLFIGYHSVYFKSLSEVKASTSSEKINTSEYTRTFWNKKLIPSLNKSLPINDLIALLKSNPDQAFKVHGHALGIGDLKYFMVKGEGKITKINENDILVLSIATPENLMVKIATEYVYGNAVRDASGLINMNEFDNTSDFNEVSAGINKIIREEVLPGFRKQAASGDRIQFVGAIELNKKFLNLKDIEITPVQLSILK